MNGEIAQRRPGDLQREMSNNDTHQQNDEGRPGCSYRRIWIWIMTGRVLLSACTETLRARTEAAAMLLFGCWQQVLIVN